MKIPPMTTLHPREGYPDILCQFHCYCCKRVRVDRDTRVLGTVIKVLVTGTTVYCMRTPRFIVINVNKPVMLTTTTYLKYL